MVRLLPPSLRLMLKDYAEALEEDELELLDDSDEWTQAPIAGPEIAVPDADASLRKTTTNGGSNSPLRCLAKVIKIQLTT